MLKDINETILVVEDEQINRMLICEILKNNNVKVISLEDGRKTIETLENNNIELILLDISMPVIDGYEVCKQVKSNPRFTDVPIIFLSAHKDEDIIVKGFEAGGQDFITKPFNVKELMLRISSNIELRRSKQELQRLNADLKDFMYIASHDLQSPLVSMSGFATMFIDSVSDKLSEEELYPIKRIEANSRKMQDLIKSLLDVSRLNTVKNEFSEIQCNEVFDSIINTLDINIAEKNVNIVRNDIPNIFGDKIRIGVLSRNIISNAIKYGGKNIEIGFDESKKAFYVKDDGVGIEPEQLENIFKPGSRLQTVKIEGVGMGLSFCKKVVELHHGEIWAESEGKGKGTTIWIKFKV
ncbi:MAG: response regulator [Candidatus Delongbacteria bacterium]|jgi:two-component system sensor histidine kinase/response regulator|nr:response regulator [Candidatus Delongbacteria bacterium]